jgi:DNA-binding SARP family transcriptional activator
VHVLGGFAVLADGVGRLLPTPSQRVASFLAVRTTPASRTTAAGTLWPEIGHDHALANLRTALWRLRRAAPGLIRQVGGGLQLSSDARVDLHESRSLAESILSGTVAPDATRDAGRHLASDLLPDLDDDWLVFERERYRELRVHALERLCDLLSGLRAHADAVQCGLLAVEGEPLRESAHRALMHAYLAEGNPARALQQFSELERRLETELQVAPSFDTMELALELRGEPRTARAGTPPVRA